jgi:hypothetical protein
MRAQTVTMPCCLCTGSVTVRRWRTRLEGREIVLRMAWAEALCVDCRAAYAQRACLTAPTPLRLRSRAPGAQPPARQRRDVGKRSAG